VTTVTTGVEAACLCIMSGVAAGGGPIDRGVDSVSRWPRLNISRWPRLKVSRWPRLKVSRWPRLKHVVVAVMMMVTMCRFLSDGVARKADRQSDRSDKAFDHGPMFSIERWRSIAASSTGEMPRENRRRPGGRKSAAVNRLRLAEHLRTFLNELSCKLDCTLVSRR
jgi:hypothetical protein